MPMANGDGYARVMADSNIFYESLIIAVDLFNTKMVRFNLDGTITLCKLKLSHVVHYGGPLD